MRKNILFYITNVYYNFLYNCIVENKYYCMKERLCTYLINIYVIHENVFLLIQNDVQLKYLLSLYKKVYNDNRHFYDT